MGTSDLRIAAGFARLWQLQLYQRSGAIWDTGVFKNDDAFFVRQVCWMRVLSLTNI